MSPIKKTIVVGLDGLEPALVRRLIEDGQLPNLARLERQGGFGTVATTYPAQTPVAWSTFATGRNPGGHGIFDFLRRDPQTYLPQLGLSTYQRSSAFAPPQAVNLRQGTTVWQTLSDAGVPSTVLRCPCSFPPQPHRGRTLAGMGVPDLRGSLGIATYYTTDPTVAAGESETVVRVRREGNLVRTHLPGPLNPRTRQPVSQKLQVRIDETRQTVRIRTRGAESDVEVAVGSWSDWLPVSFRTGMFQTVQGIVRFYLKQISPQFELYASPVNFDPARPVFPISTPAEYAAELQQAVGTYHTTGMAEDHGGLTNGRLDEEAFLAQCEDVYAEREAMLLHELNRLDEGLLFCLFDTPDRIQHMFWRFREPDHPANRGGMRKGFEHTIEEHYARCDRTLGQVLASTDEDTLVIVLSDHGFGSFRRGVNLNTWLHAQGLLTLKEGRKPGESEGDFFRDVDWSRTQAYALGLGGIYLNLAGREGQGAVSMDEAERLKRSIAEQLTGLCDAGHHTTAVRSVLPREHVYRGPATSHAPDLLVNFAAGYRASWATALGGLGGETFEDNTRRWAGDHIVDPVLVPGALLMNRAFRRTGAAMVDLAPTILDAFGVSPEPAMEGHSLFADAPATRSEHAYESAATELEPALVGAGVGDEDEELIRQRLSGLGYI